MAKTESAHDRATGPSRTAAGAGLGALLGLFPLRDPHREATALRQWVRMQDTASLRSRVATLLMSLSETGRDRITQELKYARWEGATEIDQMILLVFQQFASAGSDGDDPSRKQARERALQWSRKLWSVTNPDGTVKKGVDDGWIRSQLDGDFDAMMHWAITRGGESGTRLLGMGMTDVGNGKGELVVRDREGTRYRMTLPYGLNLAARASETLKPISVAAFERSPAANQQSPALAPTAPATHGAVPGPRLDPTKLNSALAKCVACHQNKKSLDPAHKQVTSLESLLEGMSPEKLDEMITLAKLTPQENQAVRLRANPRLSGAVQPSDHGAVDSGRPKARNPAPSCYLPEAENARRTAALPSLSGASGTVAFLAGAVRDRRLMFYDKDQVPRTWQASPIGNGRPYLLTPRNAINQFMFNDMGYFSDGGREFPWNHTAGIDASKDASVERFAIPPETGPLMDVFGATRQTHPGHFGGSRNVNGPIVTWQYRKDAIFGEVLKVGGVPYEIRLRRQTAVGWQMDVLRPYANPDELASGIREVCGRARPPRGCESVDASAIAKDVGTVRGRGDYINPRTFGTPRHPLSLSRTALESTQPTARVQTLPDFTPELRAALLKLRPFRSVFGTPWLSGEPPGWAADGGIFPRGNYQAFIPTNNNGCMKCHDSAGRHVDNFDPYPSQMFAPHPRDARRPRTWYDHIPGGNAILGFHPFAPNAVRGGAAITTQALNACLTRNGLIQTR